MSDETTLDPVEENPEDCPPEADSAKDTPKYVSKTEVPSAKYASRTDEAWGVDRNQQVRRLGERKPWMCSAHLSDGSGRLCTKAKAHGSEVCETHGAGSPQTKEKHRRELEAMLPDARKTIKDMLAQREHLPTALAAAKHVEDRTIGPIKGQGETNVGLVINFGCLPQPDQGEVIDVEAVSVDPDPTESED